MFSKYTYAIPMRDTTISDVCSAIQTVLYSQGPPKKFISDQSSEFIVEVIL